ncbi:macrophage mannose receptor 1-like [Betta splendens]|uniref:Macrophage mannose receptor 1-like n=1 Tax=Betta splendens TaxID=158456 RepID=A0A6P7N7B0_BETSP|nr:macrophage mannose receptor 1-like [Betta splendens]
MKSSLVLIMVLSGLGFLPSSFSKFYIYVKQYMSWFNAQTYCRTQYTDLASVQNGQELSQLSQLIDSRLHVWIGLCPDPDSWRWSLQNPVYYGVGEIGFRLWAAGEPNEAYYHKACVAMGSSGEWVDLFCDSIYPFVCYDGTTGTFVFVNQAKSWINAQSYCRQNYTDLASVRNQADNDQLVMLASGNPWSTHIGLYRDSWKWSDGSSAPFTNWDPGVTPTAAYVDMCVASYQGKWINIACNAQMYFVCFVDLAMRKHVVRVVMKNNDSSVEMEELKDDILQKFAQALQDQGLTVDLHLGWVTLPNENVFYAAS